MITRENIKGKMITLEGLDGCFKETNAKLLTEYIRNHWNSKTILISYPTYNNNSSIFVKKYLKGDYGKLYDIDPHTISLFYALNRYNDKINIDKLLKDGYTIIMDRYVGSNIMYQSTRYNISEEKDKFIDWCIDLEYGKNQLHKEDIVLFMYIPVELNFKNLYNRDSKDGIINDLHESNKKYQLELDANHEYVCNKLSWNIVKCYESHDMAGTIVSNIFDKDTIFSNILTILNNYFN